MDSDLSGEVTIAHGVGGGGGPIIERKPDGNLGMNAEGHVTVGEGWEVKGGPDKKWDVTQVVEDMLGIG